MAPLSSWENFYVIVGSSAGALTGLMFVVITIVAGNVARSGGGGELAAYGTPNVVHFCAVLFLSAMLGAPWESLHVVGVLLVLAGVSGVTYATIIARRVIRRARLTDSYYVSGLRAPVFRHGGESPVARRRRQRYQVFPFTVTCTRNDV